MDLGLLFALNLVLIVLAVVLTAMFAKDTELGAGFAAWFAFCLTVGLSSAGWIIFVAAHFIAKFW